MSRRSVELISKRYVFFLLATILFCSSGYGGKYTEGDELDSDSKPAQTAPQVTPRPKAKTAIKQPPKAAKAPIPPPPPPESPLFVEANKQAQAKNYKGVVDVLWPKVSELNSKEYILLAEAYAEQKSWNDVLKVCQLGIAQDAKNSDLLALQGRAHIELGKDKLALDDLKAALEANSKNEHAYEWSAKIYEKRKNNYELRAIYQDMIDKIGPRPQYFAALCKIDTMDNANDGALNNCKEAIKRNPLDRESSIYLGLVYSRTGDVKAGEDLIKKTAASASTSAMVQEKVGQYFADKKNYLTAIPYFEKCLEVAPEQENCLIGAADSEVQVQKFSQAEAHIKKLCAINRKYGVNARKAIVAAKSFKNDEWEKKFSDLADDCSL